MLHGAQILYFQGQPVSEAKNKAKEMTPEASAKKTAEKAKAKSWYKKTYYRENTIMDWGVALCIMLAAIVLSKTVYWFFKNRIKKITAKTKTKLDDLLLDMLDEPLTFILIITGFWFGLNYLDLSTGIAGWTDKIYRVLMILGGTWFVTRLIDALIEEYVKPLVAGSDSDLDDQLLPIIRKGVKMALWIVAIVIGLDNAGYDVGALLAGLGIGGLAFALAAQDTVSNLFGGFTIFTDKPFRLNDRIKVEGFDGMVREIGVRTTRLQTLEGRTVVIPNSTFSENPIENVSSEPSRKVVLNLGLTYDMDHNKVKEAMETVRSIAKASNDIEDDFLLSFNAFGDFALNIFFAYYIKKDSDILDTQTAMNMEILEQFNTKGLEFAFPSQTIYQKQI